MISSLELARLCKVSQGTVDRALHNRPGISAKTKAKVQALAKKHGYLPHPAARELLTGDRKTIGAIVPAVNSVFFMDLMNSIREAVATDGYRFLITQVGEETEFLQALEYFASVRARLVVAVPPSAEIDVPDHITRTMDLAALVTPCRGERIKNLLPDELETGRIAARYLLKRGHQRIVHLTYQRQTPAINDRARGYEQVLSEHDLPSHVLRGFDAEELLHQFRTFQPTAIFCHNDWLALQAIRSLNASGIRVPEDASMLGVDDSPTFNRLCPDITTLHYPVESIAKAIQDWLGGKIPPAIALPRVVERATVREMNACDSHIDT